MNTTEINFKPMQPDDWEMVATIYKQGIETNNATFQQEIPTWNEWNNNHIKKCRIVAAQGTEIIGWAALTPVSGRCVYAGVAEVSVYIANRFQGLGVGKNILEKLITESEAINIWTLQAGIFPENKQSISIHEKLGFRNVGYRERIGKMNGVWRDTVLLERRSKKVGIE